ncbi:2',3'-cyclic-nucleotide 3'-phosphodiesterase [Collybia nuda]|uniref:2',3'-cyclic-nucleotide 3'-phosphodiesterase n=1 Tax=Collybia nuda TaxID=64659 RepID=A0A9P6CJW1_9AGAR|nr:2',3'-cyclic-nucleotide 3'-phosphodiesterase [Collybia nuda]
MGIAIWLVPSGQDTLELKNVMRAGMGKSHLTSSYPTFDPHITVTSFPSSHNIPLSTIRAAVPESQGPIPIEFESIKIGDCFFRSVYITVKPDAALLAFQEHIQTALGLECKAPVSFPHLSLCYIDEEDARNGERTRFIRKLEDTGKVMKEIGAVGVRDTGNGHEEGWMWGFEASEIWVVACDGPIERWSILVKIPMIKSVVLEH